MEPDTDGAATPEWLARSGFGREVIGFGEATELLSHDGLHADMVGLFEGIGVRAGPVWDLASASLLSMDGERHRRFRSLIAGRFTPRAVERLRPYANAAAHRLIDGLEIEETCDFLGDFATPYVTAGTCEFMGFPAEDAEVFTEAVDLIGYAMRDLPNRIDACEAGMLALSNYAAEILEQRRVDAREDVMSVIAAAIERGDLPELVGRTLVASLVSAGHEPTSNQLGLMVATLSAAPEVWEALARQEISVGRVVEEALRYRSTNPGTNRRVDGPFEHCGVQFREGEMVLFDFAAANRDARRFAAPDRFDVDANQPSHLAFGFGPHYCLGAALARMQLQEALRALTDRLGCPVVVHAEETEGAGLRGYLELEVSFPKRAS